ncbi:aminopeptidase P N-terminal domain-containing protein [Aeromicrobium sp.]|nr:aminopeptidase P N-terminal domain-containing protein [Candidatus Saccharibacteria bacterium]
MKPKFTSEFFAGNRERLRQLFTGTAPIVVTANGLLQRGGDSSYPFQQDATFWYLTGIEDPDIVLVIDKAKEYLIVPSRGTTRIAFDGSVDAAELTRISGVQTVVDDKEGWHLLEARLRRAKHVATLSPPPAYIEEHGLYTNPARAQLVNRIKMSDDSIELLDLSQHVALLRVVKQPEELVAIQAAIDITIDTLKDITRPSELAKYAYEYEVEADLSRGFRRRGASGHSFEPIVAGGARACTLHNVANDGPLSSDELLLLDVGAEVSHYAADITRTVSLGTPSRRQQAVYNAVLEVQEFAFTLMQPGALIRDNEQKIEQFMGEKLRELGLIKNIEHDEVRRYYPHATSHFLGLNVHDIGDYSRPLEPGVVLTVEPGIYIADEGIGIRIEDDVLITPNGHQILTARLPRHLG